MCDVAVEEVEAFGEGRGWIDCFLVAEIGDLLEVGKGGVGEGWGGGDGDGGGDVGDAVVDDVFLDVDGVWVIGGTGGFEAAALVDGDVDDDGEGFHGAEGIFGDEFGGGGAGDEDAADDEVGFLGEGEDVGGVGDEGGDVFGEEIGEVLEAL